MNTSAAIAETEIRIQCGILSSLHDHAKGARPRKRGGDAPGRGRTGVRAGGLATQSVNILPPSLPHGLGSGACLAQAECFSASRLPRACLGPPPIPPPYYGGGKGGGPTKRHE